MQESQKEPQSKISPETVMGALVLLVRFASAPSRLLMVKPGTMGRRAIGFVELTGAGLFLPVFAGVLGIDRGVQWISPVSGLLCVCWVLQKLKSFGSESVEGYIGTTWIGARFPGSEALQVMGESLFWGLVLIVFGNFCPPLAFGLVISGLASALYIAMLIEREKREVQIMVNQKREQELMAERFRQMSGE